MQRVVGHQIAVIIHAVNVHAGFADRLALLVEQLDEQRVVLLEEARANPVEVHQFAVLVFRELEGRQERRHFQLVVDVNAGVDVFHVEAQLDIALLAVDCQEIDIGQRMALGDVETLELGLLQLQRVGLRVTLALCVHIRRDVLHLIGVARRLSLLVELEDVNVLIVPVVHPVAEVDALLRVFDTPHVDGYGITRQRHIGEEILARGQRLLDILARHCERYL